MSSFAVGELVVMMVSTAENPRYSTCDGPHRRCKVTLKLDLNLGLLVAFHDNGIFLVPGWMQEIQPLAVIPRRSLNFEIRVKQENIPNSELLLRISRSQRPEIRDIPPQVAP